MTCNFEDLTESESLVKRWEEYSDEVRLQLLRQSGHKVYIDNDCVYIAIDSGNEDEPIILYFDNFDRKLLLEAFKILEIKAELV